MSKHRGMAYILGCFDFYLAFAITFCLICTRWDFFLSFFFCSQHQNQLENPVWVQLSFFFFLSNCWPASFRFCGGGGHLWLFWPCVGKTSKLYFSDVICTLFLTSETNEYKFSGIILQTKLVHLPGIQL